MKNFRRLVFIFCAVTIFSVGFVQAETLFCSDYDSPTGGYGGTFDTDSKPDVTRCERLKGYDLSYESCKKELSEEIEWYKKKVNAYRRGKCQKFQTATYKYNSATCSARYAIAGGSFAFEGTGASGNKNDINACYKLLKTKIVQKRDGLRNSNR